MTYLNKSCVKIVFSADSTLNILPVDMGSDMVLIALNQPPAETLQTATGIMPSAMINCEAEVNVSILRTSSVAKLFLKKIQGNSIIGGSMTITDDDNNQYTIDNVFIKEPTFSNFNGGDPAVQLKFAGEFRVNKDIAII